MEDRVRKSAATSAGRDPFSAVTAPELELPTALDNGWWPNVLVPRRMPLDRLRVWALRGGSSILQQGLFSGAHFLTNVLLARWLAQASYGVFALAYSVFLLFLSLYMALFFEPIVVYGAGRYAGSFHGYIRILVRAHFLLLVPVSLLCVVAAPLLGRSYSREFQFAFLVLVAVAPFLLLVWLSRAAFYAQLDSQAGAIAGICYFVLLIFSIWILQRSELLSPASALCGMAVSSLLVSAGCLYRFWKREARVPSIVEPRAELVASDHWSYGRWAVLTAIVAWVPMNIYYLLLPARFGIESTAMLRALMNLMYPLLHAVIALVLFLIPFLVRKRQQMGLGAMKRAVLQIIVILVPAGVLYLLFLLTFRVPIVHLLYGGRYDDVSAWAVASIGFLPLTGGLVGVLGAAMRSLERTRVIFWSYFASTIVALAVGIPLTLRYGISGAAIALVLNDLPVIGILAAFLALDKEKTRVTT